MADIRKLIEYIDSINESPVSFMTPEEVYAAIQNNGMTVDEFDTWVNEQYEKGWQAGIDQAQDSAFN